ncbi:MAG: marine proteobacterial sortase target protein [Rhodospirillales bacterium]|nr:marine proteobacterial sortase target protein [Rhodospirillales bacterium]MCB9994967.1 marine proteobacterial sortase target protein [Rhodospirillales bacterium]
MPRFAVFILTFFIISPAYAGMEFRDEALGKFIEAPGIATEIETQVSGVIARTRVIQYFANMSDAWQEGAYSWPLPDDAAVDHQVMVIGDRRILGFVAQKDKARQIYETAKREGRATSLVEQHRANIFRTSVANIPPRSLIAIEIGYQHNVAIDGADFSLRLPLAITPRYDEFAPVDFLRLVSAGAAPDSAARDVAERLALFDFAGGHNPVRLQVDFDSGFALDTLKSPSHKIEYQKPQDGKTTIRTAKAILPDDHDFVLDWSPRERNVPLSFVHSEDIDGAVYTSLVMVPPADETSFKAAAQHPRQVSLIIDVSGSMAGPSIRQAKAALVEALQDLTPQDYFNVISFESKTDSVFAQAVPANRENITKALQWVSGLEADGGTVMLPAIEQALGEPDIDGTLRQVMFATDGAIGYEREVQRYIRAHVGTARFFAVGIGAAPNAHLMRQMAMAGRGTFTFIGDVKETREKMGALFAKMKSPVLTDLVLHMDQGISADIVPDKIPDLMTGEPVMLAVKSDKPLRGLKIDGKKGTDRWEQDIKEPAAARSGIGKLYARRKIDMLSFADPAGEKPETEAAITALGLQHQIMSAYTSMVAVDEKILRPHDAQLVSRRYDPTLPKGWQLAAYDPRDAAAAYDAMLQQQKAQESQNERREDINLPQTATNWVVQLLTGLLLCVLSVFGNRRLSSRAQPRDLYNQTAGKIPPLRGST